MNTNMTKEQVSAAITSKLARYFGTTPDDANPEQMYKAVVLTVKDILTQKRSDFKLDTKKQRGKKIYYLCMEFLVGRSLKNNLNNLGVAGAYGQALGGFLRALR